MVPEPSTLPAIPSPFKGTPEQLEALWRAYWPGALSCWSPFTQLHTPAFLADNKAAAPFGMAGGIAAIRLHDQHVMVNLEQVVKLGLEPFALEILAHEIGHHVFVPGNLSDNARMIAAMSTVLRGLPNDTPHFVANLYGDLLINDRLQRVHGLNIAGVYVKLNAPADRKEKYSKVWMVYTRAYEHLWRLKEGTLSPPGVTPEMNGSAVYISRLIRQCAGKWLLGTKIFANVLYPYLIDDQKDKREQTFVKKGLHDTKCAGNAAPGMDEKDAVPDGLSEKDESELGGLDAEELFGSGDDDEDESAASLEGRLKPKPKNQENKAPEEEGKGMPGKQYRMPFEYGQLLKSLGLNLSEHEITTRYYRERALPYLIPFPARKAPQATEPLPEGYQGWDPTEPIEDLDLFGSLVRSPVFIPGMSTVQRVYGETPGADPARTPMDLDIYVDCSGSMPCPSSMISYLALCGTILGLSALRMGARVQATLWSSAGTFETTGGFIRDEKRILGIITGYVSGGTAFPIHILRDTYEKRKKTEPTAHIVVISDDGADTILRKDEKGNDGKAVADMAFKHARGGGTFVLNLPNPKGWSANGPLEKMGYKIHAVQKWEDLIVFARKFVVDNYGS